MTKYKSILRFSDGETYEDDELFDTEEQALEHASYLSSCYKSGMETLNMSNMGDYPLDDIDDNITYELVEVDD